MQGEERLEHKPPGITRQLPPYIDYTEAYVPVQPYTERYDPTEALEKGTLFPVLYRPYGLRR